MDDTPIERVQVAMMLQSLEYRGLDASGVAIQLADGAVHIAKSDDPAWRFTASQFYQNWMKEQWRDDIRTVLVHTRKATKGSAYKADNNHPMYAGCAAVVHNGTLYNDDQLFKELKLERHAETDSDILRAIIDDQGLDKKVLKDLAKVNGSIAMAAIHPKYNGRILLVRSGNPIVIAATEHLLMWASDKRTIYRTVKPWVRKWNFLLQEQPHELGFIPMDDNSAYIIGDKGLEYHAKFREYGSYGYGCSNNSGRGLCYSVYDGNYQARKAGQRQTAKREATKAVTTPPTETRKALPMLGPVSPLPATDIPRVMLCPNPECKRMQDGSRSRYILSDEERRLGLEHYECKYCHTNLAKQPN